MICGAGTAGLAAAVELRRVGLHAEVLERTEHVAASWRSRYDDLRLNTPGWMSSMPGFRATIRRYGEFPTRDDWVRYAEDYTDHHRIPIRFGTSVERIDPSASGWAATTDRGVIEAEVVVIALGMEKEPWMPDWPGRSGYRRELLHAAEYRNARPYAARDVLVVGPNVTGSEIANLLVKGGARRVRVACRTPPNMIRRKFLGVSVNIPGIVLQRFPTGLTDRVTRLMQLATFGRLDRHGLPRSPQGIATALRDHQRAPAYDDGFVAELKAGRIEIVPAVVGFDGDDVVLADSMRISPDAVIAATGYRPGLEPLVGHLDVLDARGLPLADGGQQLPHAPGLFFNGYRGNLSGQLRPMRLGARAIAKAVTGGAR